MSDYKQDTLDKQLPMIGVTQWRNKLGITGRNIGVWNVEPDSGHGACTGQIIRDVAPNVDLHFAGIHSYMDNEKIYEIKVDVEDERYHGKEGIENYIIDNNIKIISASKSGGYRCTEYVDFWKEMQKKYNLIIFNVAANKGDNEKHETISTKFPVEVAIVIGALGVHKYRNKPEVVEREDYSSVGEELDFMQLILWYSGTSAATPCMAGMAAMILERYGYMSYQEMYKYLQMIAEDMGDPGDDVYYGNGWCKLPDTSKKYITMTTKDTIYHIDGYAFSMDTKPINKEGNVFVPIRVISEALGATVYWEKNPDKTIKIIIDKGNTHIELNTGSDVAIINGKKQYLNFASFIDENNRTLVPIRFIAEGFGCKVDWVQKESKVMILEV